MQDAINKLKGTEIEYAEPNYIYTYGATASVPIFTANYPLWGMNAINPFGSQASIAWNNGHTGSASVFVGVVDEGIQFDHPNLTGQIWTNPYDPVDGIDNDGNGYSICHRNCCIIFINSSGSKCCYYQIRNT